MQRFSVSKVFFIISCFSFIVWLFAFKSINGSYFEIAKNLDVFTSLFKEVNAQYVEEVKPERLIRNGISGMLNTLDPYTDFIAEEDAETFKISTTGQYAGIGSLVGEVRNKLAITHPYEGFPAQLAGLKVGDEILAIDNIPIQGKDTYNVSNRLKGQAKTKVNLKIKRFGIKEPINIEITREKISIKNVSVVQKLENNIGYIKLEEFTPGASKEVAQAFSLLKSEGISGLIIDLRDNPGGLLREAVNIVNLFTPKNTLVVETRGKSEDANVKFHTLNNPVDLEIPIVVLVNQGSASASEIVAGSLQDYDRAILVGQQTFGKGLVQITKPLAYKTQLKITTARYYIPSGRCIQSLNYAQRNSDGTAVKISDTVNSEFKTKAGRIVYADNGLAPDIFIPEQQYPTIIKALVEEGFFFDYATRYVNTTKVNLENLSNLKITDEDYLGFLNYLKEENFKFTSPLVASIAELEKALEKEKNSTQLNNQVESMRSIINQENGQYLKLYKSQIKLILKQQISFHAKLTTGLAQASLPEDKAYIQAKGLLLDNETYSKLLKQK